MASWADEMTGDEQMLQETTQEAKQVTEQVADLERAQVTSLISAPRVRAGARKSTQTQHALALVVATVQQPSDPEELEH